MLHSTTSCNTLPHHATLYSIMLHSTTSCNTITLQHYATLYNIICDTLHHHATFYNIARCAAGCEASRTTFYCVAVCSFREHATLCATLHIATLGSMYVCRSMYSHESSVTRVYGGTCHNITTLYCGKWNIILVCCSMLLQRTRDSLHHTTPCNTLQHHTCAGVCNHTSQLSLYYTVGRVTLL